MKYETITVIAEADGVGRIISELMMDGAVQWIGSEPGITEAAAKQISEAAQREGY